MGEDMTFYRLSELVERWKKTENDILRMAACGDLQLSVIHTGEGVMRKPPLRVFLVGEYIQLNKESVEIMLQNMNEKNHLFWHGNYKGKNFFCLRKYPFTPATIIINAIHVTLDNDSSFYPIVMVDEVARIESMFPELIGSTPQQDIPIDDEYVIKNKRIEVESGFL